MLNTVRAVVREGKIELLEPVDLPEGTVVLVTVSACLAYRYPYAPPPVAAPTPPAISVCRNARRFTGLSGFSSASADIVNVLRAAFFVLRARRT